MATYSLKRKCSFLTMNYDTQATRPSPLQNVALLLKSFVYSGRQIKER